MFTWNFEYVSKARLAETLNQLMLNSGKGDILIRIHTAIHLEEEAVELARFIKRLVPGARIFGTSTSAVISWGKLVQNQCVISITQMDEGRIKSVLLPTYDEKSREPLPPDVLCQNVKDAVVEKDTKLLLTFLTRKYLDVYRFIERCNDYFPGVQMIGGLANTPEISITKFMDSGFVFDENGWTNRGILLAAISGEKVDSFSSYSTGVQVFGDELEITDSYGTCILSIDGKDALQEYYIGVSDELKHRPELLNLFPYVYSDMSDIPIFVRISDDQLHVNHIVEKGKKLKRAFIYDKKIISDNRALFRRIENFEKAETIFGYSCLSRSVIYSNCAKWELSAYENSNMCGCIVEGEIAHVDGKNTFANDSFVVSVAGEKPTTQGYNPYVLSHIDSLQTDNYELLNYLMEIESNFEKNKELATADSLKDFVKDCELKLLYSEHDDIPNEAALFMDVKIRGYDRICRIDVTDLSSMKTVFSEKIIQLTYKNYISKCNVFAREHHYRLYIIDKWQIAIGAPSYMVALSVFTKDMERLQRELFEASEEYIALVPVFCVLDGCTDENINAVYDSARVEMMNKNIQFYVRDAREEKLDEESIRERYHMVNVINYAIAHDKIIPYFQGIYDNKEDKIHHYESLMRIEDENGTIYYPGSFLDVARSFGLLYDSMSSSMVRKVMEKFRYREKESVSLNLGIRDIKNREIVDYIYDSLSTAPHPENYVFEILENEDIDDYDVLVDFVDRIHELGGKISIDDFGSGYSNLQHIASIHSDFIKIDGSIVKRCCENPESERLIAMIAGWKKLSSRQVGIIAEFVENGEIQEKLLTYGIDFSQGYLFSKPSPEL